MNPKKEPNQSFFLERSAEENMQTFPQDENGDVFRRMQESGDHLDKPRDIDFNHVFPKEEGPEKGVRLYISPKLQL